MPNLNGYEVLSEVRKDVNNYVPVIMLSNLNAADFAQESGLENIDAYLIKSHHSPREIVDKTLEVLEANKIQVN